MELSLLKELTFISESAETKIELTDDVKAAKPHLNKIASMLFNQKCGPAVDEKRSKEAKYYGVSNTRSKLLDDRGRGIRLTFDNSTDSGEFEINSLTPLKIKEGGDLDKKIKSLYRKYKVASKKKTNYLDVSGEIVMREIHLGTSPDESAVKLVRDAIKLIRGESVEDDVEEKPKKDEEPIKESGVI